MPVKRRQGKRRPDMPDAIMRLIDGEPIEDNEENADALLATRYFGSFDLTDAQRERAGAILEGWHRAR